MKSRSTSLILASAAWIGGLASPSLGITSCSNQVFSNSDVVAQSTEESGIENLDRLFQQYDRNGDGVIRPAEVNNRRLFRKLDTNRDRQITLDEARTSLVNRNEANGQLEDGESSQNLVLASNTTTRLNVPYSTSSNADQNLTSLDIYAPETAVNAPVVVFVHGGSWMRGDKANVGQKPAFFNERGYVFVSINYRLIPDIEYPANAEDVAQAVAWVHSNIHQHGGDPNKIVLMGHSAGAHLAALVATDETYLDLFNKPLSILKGVILFDSAAYDIPLLMENPGPRAELLYPQAFSDNPSVWEDASPVSHVASGKGIPPFALIYASETGQSREAQNYRFSEVLQASGIQVVVTEIPNQDHSSINQTFGSSSNRATQVVETNLDYLF